MAIAGNTNNLTIAAVFPTYPIRFQRPAQVTVAKKFVSRSAFSAASRLSSLISPETMVKLIRGENVEA